MRLYNHWITGRKIGKYGRISIPRWKAGAANHQPDPAWNQNITFVERDILFAEPALPAGGWRHFPHRLCRISQSLDTAVKRIGATAAEGLGVALAGNVHHAVRHFEIAVVKLHRHLKAKRNARFG